MLANFTESKESEYGQFNTEQPLVAHTLSVINSLKPLKGLVLEPSMGTGNFLNGLEDYDVFTDACEIDPDIYIPRDSAREGDKMSEEKENLMEDNTLEYCDVCGDRGWIWDDLSSAMGGTPTALCHCEHGELLGKKESEEYRKKKEQFKTCPTCNGAGEVRK